jgi:hypothetical protein
MSAVDEVLALDLNVPFELRGRVYSRSAYTGSTHADGYVRIKAWNDQGKEVLLKVKDGDKLTVPPSPKAAEAAKASRAARWGF